MHEDAGGCRRCISIFMSLKADDLNLTNFPIFPKGRAHEAVSS